MANISQNVNIEMLEKLPDGTYKRKYPATKAEVVKLVDAQNKFTNKNVEGAMNELFTNVSDGKDLVGGAITDVDDSVEIPTDPTFNDLASAISGISTGLGWEAGLLMSVHQGDNIPTDSDVILKVFEEQPLFLLIKITQSTVYPQNVGKVSFWYRGTIINNNSVVTIETPSGGGAIMAIRDFFVRNKEVGYKHPFGGTALGGFSLDYFVVFSNDKTLSWQ